ncbi:MAG: hypothetical protein WCK27_00815 [Verrucomicrobiota bacterium]
MSRGISEEDFLKAARSALRDASKFLAAYGPEELLAQKKRGAFRKVEDIKRYNRLVTFVKDEWRLSVQKKEKLPRAGYASWLFALGGGGHAIALDDSQMRRWEDDTGMPVMVQRIRSIMHEAGHHHLSFGVQPPSNESELFFSEATPEEEEKAWCYAMTFFGVTLGRYALEARENRSVDDTPKILV